MGRRAVPGRAHPLQLRARGLSLTQAGLLTSAPIAGTTLALIPWGAAADRWGERLVLSLGLGLAGAILLIGVAARGPFAMGACFVLAGAAGASVHASSGRLILGWFAARERGLALPPLGYRAGLAVLVAVRSPERAEADGASQPSGSPYRTPVLWRIHAASALLIVPQFLVVAFALVYLVDVGGWQPAPAGRVLAIGGLGGAAARLLVGWWSDRSRLRLPTMRGVSVAITISIAALAITTRTPTAPHGYGAAFAVTLAFPLLAAALIPVAGERGRRQPAVAA